MNFAWQHLGIYLGFLGIQHGTNPSHVFIGSFNPQKQEVDTIINLILQTRKSEC